MAGKRGRPRRNLPYLAAREIVRGEMLKSSIEYAKWWKHNMPSVIPKRPDRAYGNCGWIGWGDFLGSNNPFPCTRRKFRSYKESRAFAQTLGCKTIADWYEKCRKGLVPADIPKRPDLYYQKSRDWIMWKDFLGYTGKDRANAVAETDHIIYIIKYPELPANVFTIGVTNEGKAGLIGRRDQFGFTILNGYYHDKESNWMELIEPYIRQYYIGDKNFICNNINDVFSVLSMRYVTVT